MKKGNEKPVPVPAAVLNDSVIILLKQASKLMAEARAELVAMIERGERLNLAYVTLVGDRARDVALLASEITESSAHKLRKAVKEI